ncbi:hypothetical protein [Schaalia sp. lx-260]|uniref:hypothetical protein n=1 Tax=Schaalia sp. lx-260 TaxID=2899082 RepID=UPI001E3204BD|nr:hypothetical protein [Schaalia sp. lx-260]
MSENEKSLVVVLACAHVMTWLLAFGVPLGVWVSSWLLIAGFIVMQVLSALAVCFLVWGER